MSSECVRIGLIGVIRRAAIAKHWDADPRAKVYDFDGNLLAVIAEDVFHPGSKNMDIAVDSRDRVYVADTVKRVIFVFSPEAAA